MTILIARRSAFRGQVAMAAIIFAATLSPASSLSQTLPSGGQVVSGDAGISANGGRLDVNQTSPTAIISWDSFSVGEAGHAHFNNGNGATLNRVRGNVESRIDGKLTATGSLYLVNPNGVAVGQNGTVETGGSFVATTLDLSDEDFARAAAGESYTLNGASNARVVNAGKIGALGGDVVLAAREVENDGDIEAASGAVGLLAGNEVLIKDRNSLDGRFLVKSRSADTSVKNTGNIKAVEVELRANGGNVYALAGNRGGIVTATGSATRNGRIFLTADENYGVDRGRVEVTGTLNARQPSKRAGAAFDGGKIRIQARSVQVSGKLNAHGSIAAASPEMLPPPRPNNPLLNGDGGRVEILGRWEDSNIAGMSLNVVGVSAGSYQLALENRPPWETLPDFNTPPDDNEPPSVEPPVVEPPVVEPPVVEPEPPVVIVVPQPDEPPPAEEPPVVEPEPVQPEPPVEEPKPVDPPPAEEPPVVEPEPVEPTPPIVEPDPVKPTPVVKPVPVSPPPATKPTVPTQKPEPVAPLKPVVPPATPAESPAVTPVQAPLPAPKPSAASENAVEQVVEAPADQPKAAAPKAPEMPVAILPTAAAMRSECNASIRRDADIALGGTETGATFLTVCNVELQHADRQSQAQ